MEDDKSVRIIITIIRGNIKVLQLTSIRSQDILRLKINERRLLFKVYFSKLPYKVLIV